jgi:hypothetical protein
MFRKSSSHIYCEFKSLDKQNEILNLLVSLQLLCSPTPLNLKRNAFRTAQRYFIQGVSARARTANLRCCIPYVYVIGHIRTRKEVHPLVDKASALKIKRKIVIYGREFYYIHKVRYQNTSIYFLFIYRSESKAVNQVWNHMSLFILIDKKRWGKCGLDDAKFLYGMFIHVLLGN